MSRDVYLPAGGWYDFWTGQEVEGGRQIHVDAPLEKMPLYMRAGSIVPLGPEIEYANQNPDGPIELRVYRGADGNFKLYNDEGDSYRYEKGAHSVIPIHWNDEAETLTLGARVGAYAGMPEKRTFHVVWVGAQHGIGENVSAKDDATVDYEGKSVMVKMKSAAHP
jgi:alpha-D-xyloside xylohydrolase